MKCSRTFVRSLLVTLSIMTSMHAVAGPYGDDMAKCLVKAASPDDQTVFIKWLFAAIALHPDVASMASISPQQRDEFSKTHDHFKLLGQDNERRYVPFEYVCVRVHADDSAFEIFTCACAAHLAGCRVTVSVP